MQQIHVCKDPLIFCCYPEVSFKQCMESIKKRVQAVRERQQSFPEVIPISPSQICQSPASCWPVQWPGTLWPRASACGGCKAGSHHVSLKKKKPFLGRGSFPSLCSVNDWAWDEWGTGNEGCPRDGWLSQKCLRALFLSSCPKEIRSEGQLHSKHSQQKLLPYLKVYWSVLLALLLVSEK